MSNQHHRSVAGIEENPIAQWTLARMLRNPRPVLLYIAIRIFASYGISSHPKGATGQMSDCPLFNRYSPNSNRVWQFHVALSSFCGTDSHFTRGAHPRADP